MAQPASPEFDAVYAQHHALVLRHAARLVGEDHAHDLAQRVWLRVFQNLDRFRGTAKPGTWLYVVTRNAAMDFFRRRSLRPLSGEPLEVAVGIAALDPGPERQLLDAEERAIVDARIRQLAPEQQAVLLAWLSGLTVREASTAFGLHPSTVKSRAHRARVAIGCSTVM